MLDPGSASENRWNRTWPAIRAIPRLKAEFGRAVLLGVSRKSFLGLITDRPVTERRPGTLAAGAYGIMAGADILRVHDVAPIAMPCACSRPCAAQ